MQWQLSPSGSLLCIHASWGVLWVHRVWSFSVGRIVCTIGWSVSFPLPLFHGCVFQRMHARQMCMVLAGQPAPVTPLSFISRVQWVCLRQVSVFPPSLQEPRHGHFRGCPRRPLAVRTRMHACMHARACPPSLSLAFHPALPHLSYSLAFSTAQGRWPAQSVTSAFPAALGCRLAFVLMHAGPAGPVHRAQAALP